MDVDNTLPSQDMKWYQIWWFVWRHPGAESFRTILRDTRVSSTRGFTWVAISSILYAFFITLTGPSFSTIKASWIGLICLAVAAPIFAVLALAIMAGIYRLIGKLFGGSGTWEKLVYCFAAISAPGSILIVPLSLLYLPFINTADPASFPWVGFCIYGLLSLALAVYEIVLNISAIDGVENTGTGKAIAIYFTPLIVAVVLSICVVTVVAIASVSRGTQ